MVVVDITDPASPQIVGTMNLPDWAYGVAVSGNYAYVADRTAGLQIVWQQCPEPVAIEDEPEETNPDEIPSAGVHLAVHPNPFNPRTTIAFSVERSEHVSLKVFDLSGRLVCVLADRTYPAGAHSIAWQGENMAGREVPSGSYVVRLHSRTRIESRKRSLIR